MHFNGNEVRAGSDLCKSFLSIIAPVIAIYIFFHLAPMNIPTLASILPGTTAADRYNAIVGLEFLSSSANISKLINNSNFTNSLGCSLDLDEKNTSCIQVCGNVTDVFSSWPNFYTCSWYPTLSEALNENPNVSSGSLLGSLGIFDHEEDLSSNISSSIANCLADYCQSSSQCQVLDSTNACSLTDLVSTSGSYMTLNRSSAVNCLRYGVCGSIDNVNPDIGGLGVRRTFWTHLPIF
jgi:hypothetical protein